MNSRLLMHNKIGFKYALHTLKDKQIFEEQLFLVWFCYSVAFCFLNPYHARNVTFASHVFVCFFSSSCKLCSSFDEKQNESQWQISWIYHQMQSFLRSGVDSVFAYAKLLA